MSRLLDCSICWGSDTSWTFGPTNYLMFMDDLSDGDGK